MVIINALPCMLFFCMGPINYPLTDVLTLLFVLVSVNRLCVLARSCRFPQSSYIGAEIQDTDGQQRGRGPSPARAAPGPGHESLVQVV